VCFLVERRHQEGKFAPRWRQELGNTTAKIALG
jgi:hypothetical protein